MKTRMLFVLKAVTISFSLVAQGGNTSGAIDGVVIDLDRMPIAEAVVYALPHDAMLKPPLQTQADKNGHFRFDGLKSNGYYLDASKEVDGYPFSPFSFYIMPGQSKPDVEVKQSADVKSVVIQLGEKAAYLDIEILNESQSESVHATFIRPDLPGTYKRSIMEKDRVAVPPVPFRLELESDAGRKWAFHNSNGDNLISLRPGEVERLQVTLI